MNKGNINKINVEFDTNYSQLLARGATLDDPIGILFEAYLLVPCYNFTKYIGTKHDEYLDGNLSSLTNEANNVGIGQSKVIKIIKEILLASR